MKPICIFILLIICSINAALAEVSLSGTVKKSGENTVLSGVKVSLSKLNKLHSVSDSNGEFKLEETTVRSHLQNNNVFKLTLKNNTLHFSSGFINQKCAIAIFSVTGKTLFFKSLNQFQPINQTVPLPHSSSGFYIVRISIGSISCTYTLTCVGNQIFLSNQNYRHSSTDTRQNTGSTSSLSNTYFLKTAAAVDTLIAEKSGFITRKIPLSSYTQKDILVSLDSSSTNPDLKKGLTIYFIRHAETVANASGQQGGGGPVEDHDTLTELGERQVEELKNYLVKENIKPDLVIVSPSVRTQKTIEPFLISVNLKAEIWVEINECCGDSPTGEPLPTERPDPRWKMKVEPISDNFNISSEEARYYWWPQSYEEGVFMVMTAKSRLLQRFSQSGKTVMVIGHAVNGGIFLNLLRGYDMIETKPERPVYLMNTAVNKLTQDTISGTFALKQNLNKPPTK